MGAEYQYRTYDQCSESELYKKVSDACDEERYESGHGGYSGTWAEKSGCVITRETFNSYDEAEDWVCENNDKWGELVAVKFLRKEKAKPNKNLAKIESLNAKVREVHTFLGINCHGFHNSYAYTVLKRVQSGKTKFKACPSCDSKIAVQHLTNVNCPVCRNAEILYNTSDQKKIAVQEAKLDKLNAELSKLHKAGNIEPKLTKDNWAWFVGGFCSS